MSDQIELEEYIAKQKGAQPPSFTIEVGSLHKAINAVKGAIERSGVPILANALFQLENGTLSISATDMDIAVTKTIAANIRAPGSFTVGCAALADILGKLPPNAVFEASASQDMLTAKCGRSAISLPTLPVDEYPQLTAKKEASRFTVSSNRLAATLGKVHFAIGNEATRPYLCGAYFHVHDGNIRVVATNGMALAMNDIPLSSVVEFHGIIVPRKSIAMLRARLADEDAEVLVSVAETTVQFDIGDTTIISKLIAGNFPEYQRVIPREVDTPVRIMAAALKRAVSLSGGLSIDHAGAPVSFAVSGDGFVVSAPKTSRATATTELDLGEFEYAGDPLEIALCSRQLDPVLNAMEGDLIFHIRDGMSTVLVKDAADPSAVYVLQPFRV